jgi:hypothetical protein
MPAEQSTPAARKARLQVHTAHPALTRLLEVLLLEWGHQPVSGEVAALHIVQEGGPATTGAHDRLTSASRRAPVWITAPLAVDHLWMAIEACLHAKPRRHLRVATRLAAELQVADGRSAVLVGSLSDHGARLDTPRELARDEQGLLHFHCLGQSLAVRGRVIYCMPLGDLGGSKGFETGLVFSEPDVQLRQLLRDFIAGSYLQRVRCSVSATEFALALPLLRLSAGVLNLLDQPPAATAP